MAVALDIRHVIWEMFLRRRVIIVEMLVIFMFSVALAFLIPKKYVARASIMPPTDQSSDMLSLSSLMGGGMGLGRMASMTLPGMATPSDLYAAVFGSATIRHNVIQRCDLFTFYKLGKMAKNRPQQAIDEALRILKEQTNIDVGSEGIIEVSVITKNPMKSAEIANAYITALDEFNKNTKMTQGKRLRAFLEQRLQAHIAVMTAVEESLRTFQQRNRTVSLSDELTAEIEMAAKLEAGIIAQRARLEAMRSYSTDDNPQIINLRKTISASEQQLRNIASGGRDDQLFVPLRRAPQVSMELARLMRTVKINTEVYALLAQQLENAKIEEVRDITTIQLLDRAQPPSKKSKPKRLFIMVLGLIFGLFFGCSHVVISVWYKGFQLTDNHTRFIEVREYIFHDLIKLVSIVQFWRRTPQ